MLVGREMYLWSFECTSLLLLTLLNPFVAEYQSDAPDNDEEYDVYSDDESVFFPKLLLSWLSPSITQILEFFGHFVCEVWKKLVASRNQDEDYEFLLFT